MGSVSGRPRRRANPKRRVINPDYERQKWQGRLLDELRRAASVRAAEEDLRDHWQQVERAIQCLPADQITEVLRLSVSGLRRWISVSEERSPECQGPLLAYLNAVDHAVLQALHLAQGTRPAPWAQALIHRAASSPAAVSQPPLDPMRAVEAHITLHVSPAGAWVEVDDGWLFRHVPPATPMRFADWKALRATAVAAVDETITELETRLERIYPRINEATEESLQLACEQFALLLTGRLGPLPRKRVEALRRFAALVQVTYPRSRQPHKNRTQNRSA